MGRVDCNQRRMPQYAKLHKTLWLYSIREKL
jgi:hypothetical protein